MTEQMREYCEQAHKAWCNNASSFILDEQNHIVCYFSGMYYFYSDKWEKMNENRIVGTADSFTTSGMFLETTRISLTLNYGKLIVEFQPKIEVRKAEDILESWI